MLSVLDMLGAMNKQIRYEARCFFYKSMPVLLTLGEPEGKNTHKLVRCLLKKIGLESHIYIPELRMSEVWDFKDSGASVKLFRALLNDLSSCQVLVSFNIQFSVTHIFRADIEALKAFFIHGELLLSPGLEHFTAFLTSLPKLKTAHIRLRVAQYSSPNKIKGEDKSDEFLRFAVTGIREKMLWVGLDNRIRGNAYLDHQDTEQRKLQDVVVWAKFPVSAVRGGHDDKLDYEAWKAREVAEVNDDGV